MAILLIDIDGTIVRKKFAEKARYIKDTDLSLRKSLKSSFSHNSFRSFFSEGFA
jgi:hypothetical protein